MPVGLNRRSVSKGSGAMFAPQQASPVTIEDQIVDHVIKNGRYHGDVKKPFYSVRYNGKFFMADDTRRLVVLIGAELGHEIKP